MKNILFLLFAALFTVSVSCSESPVQPVYGPDGVLFYQAPDSVITGNAYPLFDSADFKKYDSIVFVYEFQTLDGTVTDFKIIEQKNGVTINRYQLQVNPSNVYVKYRIVFPARKFVYRLVTSLSMGSGSGPRYNIRNLRLYVK